MINADLFEKRLHPFLDDELSGEERAQVEEYLDANPQDREQVAAFASLLEDLKLLADVRLPDDFHAKAYAKIENEQRRIRSFRLAWRSALTAVAALVILCVASVAIERYMPQAYRSANNVASYTKAPEAAYLDLQYDDYDEEANYDMAVPQEEPEIERAITFDGGEGLQSKGANPLSGQGSGQELAAQSGLKIIRTANVAIATREFDSLMNKLDEDVTVAAGYYETSSVSGDPAEKGEYAGRTADIVLRIPTNAFDEFINGVKTIEGVENVTEYNRDVTAQYVDTQLRLETLHNQFTRLEELSQKANTVTQMIEIEREMQNVLYNIETYSGNLKFWDMQVDYSTVSIYVRELPPINHIATANRSLGDRALEAFYSSISGFVGFLENSVIWIVSALPFLAVIVPAIVVLLFGIHAAKRKKN